VPPRRQKHVEAVMATHASEPPPARIEVEFKIRPTVPQLESWHSAAQASGKDLETWTIDGLDELAAEAENLPPAENPPASAVPDAPASRAMPG
jgi:hypothetical protein